MDLESKDDASASPGDTPGYVMGDPNTFLSAVDDDVDLSSPTPRKGWDYTRLDAHLNPCSSHCRHLDLDRHLHPDPHPLLKIQLPLTVTSAFTQNC